FEDPVAVAKPAPLSGSAREAIIDEQRAMADEYLVADGHAGADECMRRYLAAPPDRDVLLYLDERTDRGIVADDAAVEIDQLRVGDRHPLAQPYVGCNRHRRRSPTILPGAVCTIPLRAPSPHRLHARAASRECRRTAQAVRPRRAC